MKKCLMKKTAIFSEAIIKAQRNEFVDTWKEWVFFRVIIPIYMNINRNTDSIKKSFIGCLISLVDWWNASFSVVRL